jgi:tyrosinase
MAYPLDNLLCASSNHFGSANMMPFNPFRNVDGLSNAYTDHLYEYAPRPTCNSGDCGSP